MSAKSNEILDFGDCTNDSVNVTVQDLNELSHCDLIYLIKPYYVTQYNTYVLFDHTEKNTDGKPLYASYNKTYKESSHEEADRIDYIISIINSCVSFKSSVWTKMSYMYSENLSIKTDCKHIQFKMIPLNNNYNHCLLCVKNIPQRVSKSRAPLEGNVKSNFGNLTDCSIKIPIQDVYELGKSQIGYTLAKHNSTAVNSRCIFDKTEKSALEEGSTVEEAYLDAYPESYKEYLNRCNNVCLVLNSAIDETRHSDIWTKFEYTYAKYKTVDLKTAEIKKFDLLDNDDHVVILMKNIRELKVVKMSEC